MTVNADVTKSFSIEAVLCLTTGYLLKENFSEVQSMASWLIGYSVWTHELADDKFGRLALAQYPQLAGAEEVNVPEAKEDVASYLEGYCERARAQFGSALSFIQGHGERTETPIQSLERIAPHMANNAIVAVKP